MTIRPLTNVLAFVLCTAALAYGETYTQSFDTSGQYLSDWEVAKVYLDGYVNPNRDNKNQQWTHFNAGYLKDAAYDYDAAKSTSNTNWNSDGPGWISPATATADGKTVNGFYLYKFSLAASVAEDTTIAGTFSISGRSDDYIAAVYLNDRLLYSNEVPYYYDVDGKTILANEYQGLQINETLQGLVGALNEFVIVVHNTDASRGNGGNKDNATGLNLSVIFESNVEFDNITSETPEPATLIVFGLGLAGLGLARRRR